MALSFTVRAKSPLTVPAKVLPTPLSVALAPKVTASLYVWAPDVVTVPPLITVVPPALVVKVVRALVPPTTPPKVIVPLSFTVRLNNPFTVPAKVLPTPVSVVLVPSVTASP